MNTTNQIRNHCSTVLKQTAASIVLGAGFFLSALDCLGQGTLTITFDGPPRPLPGTGLGTTEYVESGLQFTGPVSRFLGPYFAFPDNGTVYLHTGFSQPPVAFGFPDGSLFSMISVDLSEHGIIYASATVPFVGYRPDGSSIATEFITTGLRVVNGLPEFQTFYFGPEFTGLNRVEIPGADGYSLDNLVVSIPEPGVWSLLLLGGVRWRSKPCGVGPEKQ